MVIQKILPPDGNVKSLYIREIDSYGRDRSTEYEGDNIDVNTFPIRMSKGDVISLESYMNGLALENWLDVTVIDNIRLEIKTKGRVRIQMYNSVGMSTENKRMAGRNRLESKVTRKVKDGISKYTVRLLDSNISGIVYPTIEAVEEVELLSGEYYVTKPKDINQVKLAILLNYNVNANSIRTNLDRIDRQLQQLEEDVPVIIADETTQLWRNTFIDNSHYHSNIIQIQTSPCAGQAVAIATEWLRNNDYQDVTHILYVGEGVIIGEDVIGRLMTYLSCLDVAHRDMIVQGDIFARDSVIYNSGIKVDHLSDELRCNNWDYSRIEDVACASHHEPLDTFSMNLVCMPIDISLLPYIREHIGLEYYLRNVHYNITGLNGFCGRRDSKKKEGIVQSTYYQCRDRLIAIVDTDEELSRTEFRLHIKEIIRENMKKGAAPLAHIVIEAANDFLNGPDGLTDEDCIREIEDRMVELSNNFNDNLLSNRKSIKDYWSINRVYNKLCLKIDHEYDIIIGKWTEEKVKGLER